ncbi:MAG: hypothetical protein ABI639_15720 [Thermoanaerobaculia bacterium]
MSWREMVPLPSRLWIRHAPRRWPVASEPWLDLIEHRIFWPPAVPAVQPAGERLPALTTLSDLVVLPPVGKEKVQERADLLQDLAAAGVRILDQSAPEAGWSAAAEVTPVFDLLGPLLAGDLSTLEETPERAWIVVPLLPVLSSSSATWIEILGKLSPLRPAAVVGIVPDLSPVDRRRLVDRLGEKHFEAVHHGAPEVPANRALERAFAIAVAGAGLSPFVERPAVTLPPRLLRNRALATRLTECGELWIRLGRSEADGTALLAAARHFESAAVAGLDLAALSREGNLAHLGFLSPLALQVVDGSVGHAGAPPLLVELRKEYLRDAAP